MSEDVRQTGWFKLVICFTYFTVTYIFRDVSTAIGSRLKKTADSSLNVTGKKLN